MHNFMKKMSDQIKLWVWSKATGGENECSKKVEMPICEVCQDL
jgi:hypothetical protein